MEQEIIFVAGLHGDERMPVRALAESGVPFISGNPRAQRRNVRFVERDLNASFGSRGMSYEAARARIILKKIPPSALVVDFHTTTAKTPPFAVIVDGAMIELAARTGLARVVLMRHNIKGGRALIDYRNGVSVEVGGHRSRESYRTTLHVAKNILKKRRRSVLLYEVYGTITKPGRYRNFQKHPDGFIPILAGERAYDFYGLKARLVGRAAGNKKRALTP